MVVEYERQLAHSAGLELSLCAGKEPLAIRCLLFGSPVPPDFEYICSCELVGAASSWTPRQDLLIQKGNAGAEQILKLQHKLDRKGVAYGNDGRLRFARDVVYEPPSTVFTPHAGFDRVVTNGRFKPLEVFHTGTAKGFGVWCPEKIREGNYAIIADLLIEIWRKCGICPRSFGLKTQQCSRGTGDCIGTVVGRGHCVCYKK